MDVEFILHRLDKVRPRGRDKWSACCPAHDDKNPTLAIKDAGDRILLHCFAGCTFRDICAAIGLEPYQLFEGGKAPRRVAPGVSGKALADALLTEWLVREIAKADREAGREMTAADAAREQQALKRIEQARRYRR